MADNTAPVGGVREKLPVWKTVAASYGYVLRRPGFLAGTSAGPLAISLVGCAVSQIPLPLLIDDPIHVAARWTHGFLQLVMFPLAVIAGAVQWHQAVLLGRQKVGWLESNVYVGMVPYTGTLVLLYAFGFALFGPVLIMSLIGFGAYKEPLPVLMDRYFIFLAYVVYALRLLLDEDAAPVALVLFGPYIVLCLALLRPLIAYLPAAAIPLSGASIRTAWRAMRGSTFRSYAGLAVTALPILSLVTPILVMSDIPLPDSVVTLIINMIWAVTWFMAAVLMSHVFLHLRQNAMPMGATA